MKSLKEILNEAAIEGKPDQMAVPYADTLAQNVNIREIPSGSNRGSEIDRYFDLVGLDNEGHYNSINPKTKRPFHKGYPWCAAFVYAMFHDFCKKLGLKNPLVRTAGVMKSWNRADNSLKIPISQARSNFSLVKPGQIFIQKRKGGGHTGIVTAVNTKNKTFTTIEGNTNDKLSGEGHRVGRNTRKLSQGSLVGFIDYFKGHRNDNFEKTVAKTVANAETDFSSEEYVGGLSKNDIKKIQNALLKLEYDLGTFGPKKDGVDGELGTKTNDAIADWKSKNNVPADAPLDKSLLDSITKGSKYKTSKGKSVASKAKDAVTSGSTANASKPSKVKQFVNTVKKIAIPRFFPNKLVKVDPTDISTDPNFIIKRAIIENKNTVGSFSDMILEQKGLLKRLKDAKKASDTRLADQYRDGRVKSSPIDGTGALKQGAASAANAVKDIVSSKPEMDLIYNKATNVFYLKPINTAAKDSLGTAETIELSVDDAKYLQDIFKDVEQVSTTTDTNTNADNNKEATPNLTGNVTHKYTGTRAKNIGYLLSKAKSLGITNPHSLIGLLTVVGKESGFKPKSEYSYSGTGIASLRKHFRGPLKHLTDAEVNKLKMDDVAFYDVIYGHIGVKNGYHTWNDKSNDPVLPGDGYKYRGRGFNQLTFKQSYKRIAKETGVDIVTNPDLLNRIDVAAEVAVKFLLNRFKQKGIDPNSFTNSKDAIDKYAGANAGWKKDPSRAIASATKLLPNFNVA